MIPVQLKSDVISETLETLDLLKTNMLLVLECRMQIEYEVGMYIYQMQMNSQEDIFLKNLISKNLEVILIYSSYIYKVLINVDIQAIDHKTKGFTVLFHIPSLYTNCFEL